MKNDQNSIANVAIDDDVKSFQTQRKNYHSVNLIGDQSLKGTTPTHKSIMRYLHMPVKKLPPPEKEYTCFKKIG